MRGRFFNQEAVAKSGGFLVVAAVMTVAAVALAHQPHVSQPHISLDSPVVDCRVLPAVSGSEHKPDMPLFDGRKP